MKTIQTLLDNKCEISGVRVRIGNTNRTDSVSHQDHTGGIQLRRFGGPYAAGSLEVIAGPSNNGLDSRARCLARNPFA